MKEEKCTFPIWGFSASPDILGGNVLYHVGGQASGNILALDIITGKTKWAVGKDKKAGYAPPLLIESEGEKQLICWGPNKIMGLPIGGGEEYWNIPYEVKYGVSIAKPIFEEALCWSVGTGMDLVPSNYQTVENPPSCFGLMRKRLGAHGSATLPQGRGLFAGPDPWTDRFPFKIWRNPLAG